MALHNLGVKLKGKMELSRELFKKNALKKSLNGRPIKAEKHYINNTV